ncbi:hypothetical protein [Paraliobacillus sp. JSM ZJ581]|uniref:hypothetical protein n=1 Tax=Paraliobacillus sp. JSM ZJ581 TaxID=3342118 RepID=UPI0035A96869
MSIYSSHSFSTSRLLTMNQTQAKVNTLRVGQIVSGKVLEIYPNQRAMIQLGDQQVIAQLKTALTLKNNYWFQVQENDQLLHLKVLIDQSGKQSLEKQAAALLKQLQLPMTKENLQFIQKLIQSQITFNPRSLGQALELKQNNIKTSMPFLLDMMAKQLPITTSVYRSLTSVKTESIQQQLYQIYQQLQSSNQPIKDKQLLLNRIESMIYGMTSNRDMSKVVQLIQQQMNQGDQAMLHTLKQVGLLDNHLDTTQTKEIKNQLQSIVNQHGENYISKKFGETFSRQLGLTDQQMSQFKKIVESMVHSGKNHELQTKAQRQLQVFLDKYHLGTRLASLFPVNERAAFTNWRLNPEWKNIEPVLSTLKSVADQQLPQQAENKVIELLTLTRNNVISTKDQFLLQLKHFLNFSGVLDEYQLAKNDVVELKHNFSLKQLLLQASSAKTGESEQLINTLNGLQLSSVQEEGAFIQTSVQLPGFLGSNQNITINMDSKKNESNQIDPDYCHIVFFLSLEKIGDTCIDMSVLNRKINLTVYNKNQEIIPLLDQLEPMLQDGLQNKEYKLMSIQFKQFSEEIEHQLLKTKNHIVSKTGVDVRV